MNFVPADSTDRSSRVALEWRYTTVARRAVDAVHHHDRPSSRAATIARFVFFPVRSRDRRRRRQLTMPAGHVRRRDGRRAAVEAHRATRSTASEGGVSKTGRHPTPSIVRRPHGERRGAAVPQDAAGARRAGMGSGAQGSSTSARSFDRARSPSEDRAVSSRKAIDQPLARARRRTIPGAVELTFSSVIAVQRRRPDRHPALGDQTTSKCSRRAIRRASRSKLGRFPGVDDVTRLVPRGQARGRARRCCRSAEAPRHHALADLARQVRAGLLRRGGAAHPARAGRRQGDGALPARVAAPLARRASRTCASAPPSGRRGAVRRRVADLRVRASGSGVDQRESNRASMVHRRSRT